jgi:hypothetical protein
MFGGAVNRNSIFSNVIFIAISYPLHVSAPTGQNQKKSPKQKTGMYTIDNLKITTDPL